MNHTQHQGATKRRRFQRIRAVLASGLVLGIGAALTLAAWNDQEHSAATFTAGHFGLEGSTNGTAFAEHPTADAAATLAFQLPTATAMAPGTTVYALYSVRTVNPSLPGSVQLTASANNSAGLGQYLRYGVKVITGVECNAATYQASTNQVVGANSALTTGSSATQPVAAHSEAQVNYCFAVTLPANTPNAAQGTTLTASWQFVGTSAPQ